MQRKAIAGWVCLMLAVMTAAGGARVWGDDYPYQGQANFVVSGTVTAVDIDRDRIALTADGGHAYTLDTYKASIALRGTDKRGMTADLVPGMRLRARGTRVSADIVEADTVTVLPYVGGVPPGGVQRPIAPPLADQSITLRGTVESVDNNRGAFVVRVNDHTRTIMVNERTDYGYITWNGPVDRILVNVGDRVTVAGTLKRDGTVLAAAVTRRAALLVGDAAPHRGVLTGPITRPSNHLTSRDIKVRVSVGQEVTVHVPRDTPIQRDGRPISVHSLSRNDVVRVEGAPDGDDFKASRIVVLRSNDDGL